MIVPFGATRGFSLQNEVREIAIHYSVRERALRRHDRNAPARVREAQDALYWKLTEQRALSAERVGQLLKVSRSTVERGAIAHKQRLLEFFSTAMLEPTHVT